jgi:membrane protease YdiL (CAAX protease family)
MGWISDEAIAFKYFIACNAVLLHNCVLKCFRTDAKMILDSSNSSVKINNILLAAIFILEIIYIYIRTALGWSSDFLQLSDIEKEMIRTVFRGFSIVFILLTLWRFKSLPSFSFSLRTSKNVIILIAVMFMYLSIIYRPPKLGLSQHLTFALTTIFVAIREEFVYRYVVQNWLVERLFPKVAMIIPIIIGNFVFVLYHLGAQPLYSFLNIFIMGIFMSYIYHLSGRNIIIAIVCHLVVDLILI